MVSSGTVVNGYMIARGFAPSLRREFKQVLFSVEESDYWTTDDFVAGRIDVMWKTTSILALAIFFRAGSVGFSFVDNLRGGYKNYSLSDMDKGWFEYADPSCYDQLVAGLREVGIR